jgi:hypothetical protein
MVSDAARKHRALKALHIIAHQLKAHRYKADAVGAVDAAANVAQHT